MLVPVRSWEGVSSAELQRRVRLRPRGPAELFTGAQWQAAMERQPEPRRDYQKQVFERRFPEGKGVIPLDEKLLTRVSFVGMSLSEVRELLGPSRTDTDQPFGELIYGMWPMVEACEQPALILRFEPDRELERRVVSEVIKRRIVICVT